MGRKWKKRFSKLSDEDINAKIAEFLEKKEYKSEDEAYDYKKYMKTKAWAKLRDAFLDKHGNCCEICASKVKNQAHHNNYFCVGAEEDADLVSICWECHHEFHKTVKSTSLKKPEKWTRYPPGSKRGETLTVDMTMRKGTYVEPVKTKEGYTYCTIEAKFVKGYASSKHKYYYDLSCSMCRKVNFEYEITTEHRELLLCERCHKIFKDKIKYPKCHFIRHGRKLHKYYS